MSDIDFDELDKAVASVLNPSTARTSPPDSHAEESDKESLKEEPVGRVNSIKSTAIFQSRMQPSHRSAPQDDVMQPRESIQKDLESKEAAVSIGSDVPLPEQSSDEEALKVSVKPASTLATKRTGRFMDIMHPAGDMKQRPHRQSLRRHNTLKLAKDTAELQSTDDEVTQSATTTKKGDSVQVSTPYAATENASLIGSIPLPKGASSEESTASHNDSLAQAINELFVQEGHQPVGEHKPEEHVADLSDSITEVAEESQRDTTIESVTGGDVADNVDPHEEEASTTEDIPYEESPQDSYTAAPQTTPFLADAVVEKRPLGTPSAPTADQSNGETQLELSESVAETTELPVSADPEGESMNIEHATTDVQNELPPELHKDLLAIESNEATLSKDNSEHSTDDSKKTPAKKPAAGLDSSESSQPAVASIVPQYRTPRAEVDTEKESSIFDTEQYHQPLQHPEKHSNGWGWVIGIVIVIIVCVAAAIFAWQSGLFVTPL